MIIFCEECGTRYTVDLDNIKGPWHSFRCRECNFLITISREKPTEIINPDVALRNQLAAGENCGPSRKKRILVVDDSKLFRRIIKQILESDGTLEVVGEAANGQEALQYNQELKPDLITLDVNMPGMGGTSVLKRFMLTHPCPVVIVSNLSNRSQDTIIDFLRLGAVDFLVKPQREQDPDEVRAIFLQTVHDAAGARVEEFRRLLVPQTITTQIKPAGHSIPCRQLALILSGAGGIAELFSIFSNLPSGFDGTLIVLQTMPRELIPPLVAYLNQICRIQIIPITQQTKILAGQGYIGTSDMALEFRKQKTDCLLTPVHEAPALNTTSQRSDRLFQSVADGFTGTFTLTILSGARACSLATLRYLQTKSGTILIKQPATCMIPDFVHDIKEAGIMDTEMLSQDIVPTIITYLHLQCLPLPETRTGKNTATISQKRHFQRIHFTLQTGPRFTLGYPESTSDTLKACILDLSEAGIGFAAMIQPQEIRLLKHKEAITILAVTGAPHLELLVGVKLEIRWLLEQREIFDKRYGGLLVDLSPSLRDHLQHLVATALQTQQSALSGAGQTS